MGTAHVDPSARPAIVRCAAPDGSVREAYLDWERALDDAGQLRSCVACGCPRLFRRRTLPRFAPFALLLASAGTAAAALGYSSHPAGTAALVALVALDVAVIAFARTELACYRCGTVYRRTRIASYHRAWDPRTAADPELAPEGP